ncbi:MAG: hypothetical protein C0483_22740 [Pirellula sp.]|nr:hypothetical protein [Pirellula sp.]
MSRSALFVFVALCFVTAVARAERPPESQDDATHVVVGEVAGVYVRETREQHDYVIKILVEKVERGEGVQEGDAFYAECFQRKRNAPRIPAPYGHTSVPREGDRIRAFVIRGGDRSEGIYKDWYVKVK